MGNTILTVYSNRAMISAQTEKEVMDEKCVDRREALILARAAGKAGSKRVGSNGVLPSRHFRDQERKSGKEMPQLSCLMRQLKPISWSGPLPGPCHEKSPSVAEGALNIAGILR